MSYSFVQIKSYGPGGVFTASSVANHVGGNTTYTGGFGDDLSGHSCTISGFANGNNNGTFTVQSNTSTTLTVNNANGVSQATASTNNVTFGSASLNSIFVQISPTVGNFLICAVWIGNSSAQTLTSVSDTVNTWSNASLHINNGGVNSGTSLDMWYAPVTTGGTLNVTATWPSGGGYSHMFVAEYSGVTSFDFGTTLGGSQTTPSITLATATSNELMIWTLLDQGFTAIVWNQATITSRQSINNGGPVANGSFSFAEQPNPLYYTQGSTTLGGSTNIIMQAAAFKTNTSVSNALSPYIGYGVNDCGGQALPAQEPSPTVFSPQTNSLVTPVEGGSKGPTNSGVFYQSGGGGNTPGNGQIFPTGRS